VRKKPLQSDRRRSKSSRARAKPRHTPKSPKRNALPYSDSTRRLQSILGANEIATWTWDVAKNRVVADKNLARIFGVTAKDAAGGPIEKYIQAIHPDDRARVSAAIDKTLKGSPDRYEIECRIIRKNGAITWVSARGTVERAPNGKVTHFPGVVVDISDRKSSEHQADELRYRIDQQRRIFDLTLSSISDFAYIFDRDGCFVFINQSLLDLWGLKFEQAVGKNFYELNYPDELAARLQRQIRQVFDSKSGLVDETPYTSPTGAGGYYEYIFRPVFDREGNVEFVAGSTRDISDRKRVEEQLRQSEERYRTLAATLENQVQARTKELEARNNEILVQTEMLRDLSIRLMETQDEERRHIAREMHDSAGQTISALTIGIARILKATRSAHPDLTSLVEEAQTLAEELAKEVRTTSYLLHPPMLDEVGLHAALGWYIDGVKQRSGLDVALLLPELFERPAREIEVIIFRIVQECLTNVHRHSQSKSAQIRITRENSEIVIEVRDKGVGMSPNQLDRIRTKGAGVGLRGMRERVRPFGGSIRIDSNAGGGTRVVVTLPEKPILTPAS
jgi:PAS domain S-box-containing protein